MYSFQWLGWPLSVRRQKAWKLASALVQYRREVETLEIQGELRLLPKNVRHNLVWLIMETSLSPQSVLGFFAKLMSSSKASMQADAKVELALCRNIKPLQCKTFACKVGKSACSCESLKRTELAMIGSIPGKTPCVKMRGQMHSLGTAIIRNVTCSGTYKYNEHKRTCAPGQIPAACRG